MRIRLLSSLIAFAALLSACSASDLASALPTPAPDRTTPIVHGGPDTVPTRSGAQPLWGHRAKTSGCSVEEAFPDSACTPGDILPQATKEAICTPGYSRSVRDVPTQEKDAVYAEYGIASHSPGQYEVDHFVSLELGGSNDISNLWPEAASPKPGFHEKDEVENALHDQVCSGQVDLATAQREIATDWLSIYDQIHGLPSSAHLPANPSQPQAPQAPSAAATAQPSVSGGVASNGGACPVDYPIKGNIRSDGTKIYHPPNDPSYARTLAEQCFATAADAEAAGFRAPR